MQEYNKKNSGLILAIDFRKAFDSINHSYIQSLFKKFNFGKDICDGINHFFNNREGRILLNGHLTDIIQLERGVPQGDIISPFIFNPAYLRRLDSRNDNVWHSVRLSSPHVTHAYSQSLSSSARHLLTTTIALR